jgi:pimeloyl-ACP methyl ester carboxylesterase
MKGASMRLPMLQEIGKQCRVFAPDLRFHGDSDKPKWVGCTVSQALLISMMCILYISVKRMT